MEFHKISACEIASGVINKKWTAEEVTAYFISRIKNYDKKINAVVTLCEEDALCRARAIDAEVNLGHNPGVLAGVPFLVKDNFCTDGIETTCCSKMLKGWTPKYDASAVKYMKEAGAVLLGKANMDEFAMGSTTESSIFGATSNPHDLTRVPGGSSGGSAAAVAAGFCPVALGSDTGGSVRLPSAFCGIYGMKPTYGEISRFGIVAYASSLDQVGPMAKSIEDIALLMDVMARPDINDTTCDAYTRPSFSEACLAHDLKGKKIGRLVGFDKSAVDPSLLEAMDKAADYCAAEGACIQDVELPIAGKYSVPCYYMTALGDASSKLACYDGMRYGFHSDGRNLAEMYMRTRNMGFGKEVRRRILVGTCILTRGYYDTYYVPAMKVRQLIADEYEALFSKIDTLIMPISASLPYKKGLAKRDPIKVYLGDAFSTTANLAGLPSISLYCGMTKEGLPAGIQLMGPRFGDAKLISCAALLEKHFGKPKTAELDLEGGSL